MPKAYHNMDFRKNAKHLICELTTEWIFSLACALIYIFGITFYGSGAENYSFSGSLTDPRLCLTLAAGGGGA